MEYFGLKLGKKAYTVGALICAGVPPDVAKTMRVDDRIGRANPERAIEVVGSRTRTREPIVDYVWGPDAMWLLQGLAERHAKKGGNDDSTGPADAA